MGESIWSVTYFNLFFLSSSSLCSWYKPNYSLAQPLKWGRGLGCDFCMKSCKDWIDSKRLKNDSIHPFCDKGGSSICSHSTLFALEKFYRLRVHLYLFVSPVRICFVFCICYLVLSILHFAFSIFYCVYSKAWPARYWMYRFSWRSCTLQPDGVSERTSRWVPELRFDSWCKRQQGNCPLWWLGQLGGLLSLHPGVHVEVERHNCARFAVPVHREQPVSRKELRPRVVRRVLQVLQPLQPVGRTHLYPGASVATLGIRVLRVLLQRWSPQLGRRESHFHLFLQGPGTSHPALRQRLDPHWNHCLSILSQYLFKSSFQM